MRWAGLTNKNLIMKTELNKNDKLSTEQETPPIANLLLADSVCLHMTTYIDEDNFQRCQKCEEIVD